MATPTEFREIALSYPGVYESDSEQHGYSVKQKDKHKGIAWQWMERVDPKKKKEPNPGVYAFKTPNLVIKDSLLAEFEGTGKVFTEPHYDGFAAVLVRIELVSVEELREIFEGAYHCFKPDPKSS